jgi:hypothetical protein
MQEFLLLRDEDFPLGWVLRKPNRGLMSLAL